MIELIPVIVAVIGTAILAYTDYKTTYMPNKITHSMLLIGLAWVLFFDPQMISTLTIALIVFVITFVMYLFGQMGGGDMKLFTALTLLIPYYPKAMIPIAESIGITPVINSPYPLLFPIFLLAGLIGPMFIISIWYFFKLSKIRKKIKEYNKKLIKSIILIALLIPFIFIWFSFSKAFLILFLPVITSFLILPFKNDILKHFSMKKKKISKLDDDDVLALEFISKTRKKQLGLWRKTFTAPELKKIKAKAKKLKIKQIEVYDYLPQFGPFILLSLLINLLVGDFLFYLLMIV